MLIKIYSLHIFHCQYTSPAHCHAPTPPPPCSCSLDPSKLSPEETHEMFLDLDEGEGQLHFLLTISGLSQRAWSEEVDGEHSSVMTGPSHVDWEGVAKKYVSCGRGERERKEIVFNSLL